MTDRIKVKCVFTGEEKPSYGSEKASGIDLRALNFREVHKGELLPVQEFGEEGYVLQPFDRILVGTGLSIQFPDNIDATIRPRSGLTLKHGIVAQLGTIDSDYRGEQGIILLNNSKQEFVIHKGDRLAQLVFGNVVHADLEYVDSIHETYRGSDGFGSTGRK